MQLHVCCTEESIEDKKLLKPKKLAKKIQFTCQRGKLIDIDIQIAVHHTLREIFS